VRKRCPECGQPIKETNLGEHVARLHPKIPRRRYAKLGIPTPRRPPSGRPVWIPFAVILIATIVGVAVYLAATTRPSAGRLAADHQYYDLGVVPQNVVEHSFRIANEGDEGVSILTVWTSCACTSAHLVIGGVQSPHFGMHDNPAWTGRLGPGASGTLVVLYDATAHPDLYSGERSVFVRTDDPGNPEMEFRIRVTEG
jgi:hypothetical protein